jgi:hypothetical protein
VRRQGVTFATLLLAAVGCSTPSPVAPGGPVAHSDPGPVSQHLHLLREDVKAQVLDVAANVEAVVRTHSFNALHPGAVQAWQRFPAELRGTVPVQADRYLFHQKGAIASDVWHVARALGAYGDP